MNPVTFRQIAEKLGVSLSTVSRAFHGDPRISRATTRLVMAALKTEGYQLDPIVSAGMSKIRQRSFYRETIAWCGEKSRTNALWFRRLHQSGVDYAARLGYKIEYFPFEKNRQLSRLGSIWKARGIRGAILGPFQPHHEPFAFPWHDFAWVVIGKSFEHPAIHTVARDFQADICTALQWLEGKGCRRICFIQDRSAQHASRHPMLLASLGYYHGIRSKPKTPYFEPDPSQPGQFKTWVKENRPDGLILPDSSLGLGNLLQALATSLPTAFLTPPTQPIKPGQAYFTTRFEVMGQASVNLMHRLLTNREIGIPRYKETVTLNSELTASEG